MNSAHGPQVASPVSGRQSTARPLVTTSDTPSISPAHTLPSEFVRPLTTKPPSQAMARTNVPQPNLPMDQNIPRLPASHSFAGMPTIRPGTDNGSLVPSASFNQLHTPLQPNVAGRGPPSFLRPDMEANARPGAISVSPPPKEGISPPSRARSPNSFAPSSTVPMTHPSAPRARSNGKEPDREEPRRVHPDLTPLNVKDLDNKSSSAITNENVSSSTLLPFTERLSAIEPQIPNLLALKEPENGKSKHPDSEQDDGDTKEQRSKNLSPESDDPLLDHRHLQPGDTVSLLSHKATLQMYRDNAKKTNDPMLSYELAVFMLDVSRSLEFSQQMLSRGQDPAAESEQLAKEAMSILRRLADRGHVESQYLAGDCCMNGYGMSKGRPDLGLAYSYFVQAGKRGHPDAAYRAGTCYEKGWGCRRDPAKAVQFYKMAASRKHPGAQYRLGTAELNGELGLKRLAREGVKWLKRSAENATPEFPHALHELALLHEKGIYNVLFVDNEYSCELLAQAVEMGYAPSAYKLGVNYEYGRMGCPQDSGLSIHMYNIAAQQNHKEACFALTSWYLVGVPGILPQSDTEAYLWAKRAAEQGLAKAEYACGYFCENGIGTPRDLGEAKGWYQRAVEHGDNRASSRLNTLSGYTAKPVGIAADEASAKNLPQAIPVQPLSAPFPSAAPISTMRTLGVANYPTPKTMKETQAMQRDLHQQALVAAIEEREKPKTATPTSPQGASFFGQKGSQGRPSEKPFSPSQPPKEGGKPMSLIAAGPRAGFPKPPTPPPPPPPEPEPDADAQLAANPKSFKSRLLRLGKMGKIRKGAASEGAEGKDAENVAELEVPEGEEPLSATEKVPDGNEAPKSVPDADADKETRQKKDPAGVGEGAPSPKPETGAMVLLGPKPLDQTRGQPPALTPGPSGPSSAAGADGAPRLPGEPKQHTLGDSSRPEAADKMSQEATEKSKDVNNEKSKNKKSDKSSGLSFFGLGRKIKNKGSDKPGSEDKKNQEVPKPSGEASPSIAKPADTPAPLSPRPDEKNSSLVERSKDSESTSPSSPKPTTSSAEPSVPPMPAMPPGTVVRPSPSMALVPGRLPAIGAPDGTESNPVPASPQIGGMVPSRPPPQGVRPVMAGAMMTSRSFPPGARPGMPPNAQPGARPGMPPNVQSGARPGMPPNANAPEANNVLQLHPSAASGVRPPAALQPSLRPGPRPFSPTFPSPTGPSRPNPHRLPGVSSSPDGAAPRANGHGVKPGSPPFMPEQHSFAPPAMQPGRPPSPSSPFGRPPTRPFSPSAVRMPRMPSQSSMHQSGNGPPPPKPGQMMNVSLPAPTNQPHLGRASPRPPVAQPLRPKSPPPFLASQQPNRPPVPRGVMPPGSGPSMRPPQPPAIIPPPPRSPPARVNQPSLRPPGSSMPQGRMDMPSGPTAQGQSPLSKAMVSPPKMSSPDRPPFAPPTHVTPPKTPAKASGFSTPDSSSSKIMEFKDAESDNLNFGSATTTENAAAVGEDGDKSVPKKWLGFL